MPERRRPHKENERQGKKREKILSDTDKDTDTDIDTHTQAPYSEKLSHGRVDSGHERKNDSKIEKMRTLAQYICMLSFGDTVVTQQKYIYAARLHCQKNRASAALIVFVVVLSNCILLSIDKMSTPVLYGSLMNTIRKTISDEKDFYGSAKFKEWVIKFKFLRSYYDWEFDLKASFQMKVDQIQAIIHKKQKENAKIFMDLQTLAKGMTRTQDYEKQKSLFMLLVQKNNQEIILNEMSICQYKKAFRIALSDLGTTQIVDTALKKAYVIYDKIQECEKEIDDLKKQEKDELEQQELIPKALRKNKTRKFVIIDIEEVQESIPKALRKNKTSRFVIIDIEEVQESIPKALRKNKTRKFVIIDIEEVQESIPKALRKNKTRKFVIIDIEEVQDPLSQ
jgi:precorrin isomerase